MALTYRFGVFLFDSRTLELSRDGRPVRLQPQPAQVLATLLLRAGQLVTREELRQVVWRGDTFVDFERGLNFCIAQIRGALGDTATTPRYIRTSPRKGYEFICPVHVLELDAPRAEDGEAIDAGESFARTQPTPTQASVAGSIPSRHLLAAVVGVIVVAGMAAYSLVARRASRAIGPPVHAIVAVARFDNETGDPDIAHFTDYLTDSFVEQMTSLAGGRYEVIGNAAILRGPRDARDIRAIGAALGADYVILGQVQRDAERTRVLGHLIRLPDQTHVSVTRIESVDTRTLAATTDIATRMARNFAPRVQQAMHAGTHVPGSN